MPVLSILRKSAALGSHAAPSYDPPHTCPVPGPAISARGAITPDGRCGDTRNSSHSKPATISNSPEPRTCLPLRKRCDVERASATTSQPQ